ncbi:MAG: phytanoyl-CoA dioxygenase family protein, partial [Pseudomonadota bacterium]
MSEPTPATHSVPSSTNGVPLLSPEQVQTFRDQGFVHIPHLFDLATVERLLSWTDEMVARPERPGEHMVYYEDDLQHPGKRVLSRIENFCPYHEQFDALLRRGALKQCVDEAMETDAVLFKEKVNFKLPGADGFKAHQDAQAGWNTYAPYHVTVLVSLDATTVENGCLEIAPCPGGQSLIGDLWSPLSDDQFDPARYQSLPTAPGDAVLFDSYVP